MNAGRGSCSLAHRPTSTRLRSSTSKLRATRLRMRSRSLSLARSRRRSSTPSRTGRRIATDLVFVSCVCVWGARGKVLSAIGRRARREDVGEDDGGCQDSERGLDLAVRSLTPLAVSPKSWPCASQTRSTPLGPISLPRCPELLQAKVQEESRRPRSRRDLWGVQRPPQDRHHHRHSPRTSPLPRRCRPPRFSRHAVSRIVRLQRRGIGTQRRGRGRRRLGCPRRDRRALESAFSSLSASPDREG